MKAIFYLPVPKEYVNRWDYYQVDLQILNDLFDDVVVCNSIYQVFKARKGASLIYCWWWHSSVATILLCRLLGIASVVTGAIHMFDISGAQDFYKKNIFYRIFSRISLRFASANLFISLDQFRQVTSHIAVNNPIIVRSSLLKTQDQDLAYFNENSTVSFFDSSSNKKLVFLSVLWQTQDQFRRKGLWETLQAMYLLKRGGFVDFKWIVAGKHADATEELEIR